jgi:AtzE family amidohydrolase
VTASEIAAAVRAGRLSAAAHLGTVFARIGERNAKLNCFVDYTRERAMAAASSVDAAVAAGRDPGPLAGVPYAVKNNFDVAGLSTLAGSKINRDLPPAKEDATLVTRMDAAGAVLVGTLNMDEYAYGFSTENTHYGPTRNPHNPAHVAGGSSGGSAAAVAAGMLPVTLGTDTSGSIRVPSSYCGIWGLKPTYGRLSRAGTFPFTTSLDHVGPFATSVGDLALLYDALQGPDSRDPVCRPTPAEPLGRKFESGLDGLRIARAVGYFEEHAEPEVTERIRTAASSLGATRTLELPEANRARAASFILTACESAQLHLPNLRKRAEDFEPLIRDRLLSGVLIPAAWYLQAQRFRRWYWRTICRVFESVDVILAPSTPRSAQPIGTEYYTVNGVEMLARPNTGLLTQPISFIGLPVVAAPVGRVDGMPIGMQIIAAPWREDACLRVAAALERSGTAKFEQAA